MEESSQVLERVAAKAVSDLRDGGDDLGERAHRVLGVVGAVDVALALLLARLRRSLAVGEEGRLPQLSSKFRNILCQGRDVRHHALVVVEGGRDVVLAVQLPEEVAHRGHPGAHRGGGQRAGLAPWGALHRPGGGEEGGADGVKGGGRQLVDGEGLVRPDSERLGGGGVRDGGEAAHLAHLVDVLPGQAQGLDDLGAGHRPAEHPGPEGPHARARLGLGPLLAGRRHLAILLAN
eukprot:scaffold174661_cov27-Prasinocladus_malaysianus.AAC.1